MNAVATLLDRLIDYAGLYPPEALDMRTAVDNYLSYGAMKHSDALGRFIVDIKRLEELREVAGAELVRMRLSVIVSGTIEMAALQEVFDGYPVEAVEIKCDEPLKITRLCNDLPRAVESYFEINLCSSCSSAIDALASVDGRAKLRMGGVVPEAFPASELVVRTLRTLADRRVPFKATAGLHHAIRGEHPLTHGDNAESGLMHGFLNLFCAACSIYGEAGSEKALEILEEQDVGAFSIGDDCIRWRDVQWNWAQIGATRQHFFTGYGSCSFIEPVQELEELGWL